MKVRAKFECVSIEDCPNYKQKVVSFTPVIKDDSEENKSFSKFTPSGRIALNISYDTSASEAFDLNKEYYVDFTEVKEQ